MWDLILRGLELLWALITSDSGNIVLTFILFVIQMTIIYGCITIILNTKVLQTKKERSMDYVDSTIEDINSLMLKRYYILAIEEFGEDYLEQMEVQVTEYLYTMALRSRKNEMRKRVRKNGFDLKTPEQWRVYTEREIAEDITAVTHYLTTMWPRNSVIRRQKVYDENTKIIDEFRHKLGDMYCEMLCIANTYKLKRFFAWRIVL